MAPPVRRSAAINVMVKAAEKAAKSLVRDFGEVENLQVSRKGPSDFVSAADKKAEAIIVEELMKARPGFSFLLEEGGEIKGTDPDSRFIVDPLDGTHNFLRGIPYWSITIGLEQRGEIVAGIVYNPVTDELYYADKGTGAFLNSRRLRVSQRKELGDAMMLVGIPANGYGDFTQFDSDTRRLMQSVSGTRSFGSCALDMCAVASARADIFTERYLKPWDCAAGTLIVREAGGFVGEIGGGRNPVFGQTLVATNAALHDRVQQLMAADSATKKAAGKDA